MTENIASICAFFNKCKIKINASKSETIVSQNRQNKCQWPAVPAIKPILNKTKGLNKTVKILCYKLLIQPVISYGFPALTNNFSHQMEGLRIFNENAFTHV